MKLCKYNQCANKVKYSTLSLCNSHYMQTNRGNQLKPLRRKTKEIDIKKRLKENIIVDKKTKCWNWNLTIQQGYGIISINGKMKKAHRVSYSIYKGDINDGLVIHHTCANSSCINPKHLVAVSQIDNVAEMRERQWYLKRIKELEHKVKELTGV